MAKKSLFHWAVFHLLLLAVFLAFAKYASADANSDYKAGSDFAKQIKGQGESTLKSFKPESELPSYSANPNESKYYGGVSANGDKGLANDGTNNWNRSDVGKSVNDLVLNNPKDPISPDATFIKAGKDAEANANNIVGNMDGQCQAQTINRTEYTSYTCERDVKVEQYCTRTASIVGDWVDSTTEKDITIDSRTLRFSEGKYRAEVSFIVPANMGGEIIWGKLVHNQLSFKNDMTLNILGTAVSLDSGTHMFYPKGNITAGQNILMYTSHVGDPSMTVSFYMRQKGYFVITLHVKTGSRVFKPRIAWTESCPFSKTEGAIQKTECIEAGGNKTITVEGQPYTLYQSCWAYKDTYMTQAADAGTCQAYMDNPACTLATRQCAFKSEEGTCLHENATYSCETKTSGKVMICGGDVFCLDGECDKAQNVKNNDFAHAVSQLAAVAAAGKDVSALNGVDVRAFTGQAKFCKKFAVGFSNCCQDSGWGNDVGLASCSSGEKALGKAKEKKLTVSLGEFCSNKVLGVCVEKKRSYCQFDSKLAQIVQQQGRAWQLGIGFGSAKNPDCRGITVEELQRINFDRMDFSNFFDDLMNNQKVPSNNTLLNKVKSQINNKLKP